MGEIICEIQQNSKIDGKFKVINSIYDDKNFAEDPLEIHPKTCNDKSYIPEESVDIGLINSNKMIIIAKPIKVLPMNIVIPMIQIKLHFIAKLLLIA